jgi:hypothetical protein
MWFWSCAFGTRYSTKKLVAQRGIESDCDHQVSAMQYNTTLSSKAKPVIILHDVELQSARVNTHKIPNCNLHSSAVSACAVMMLKVKSQPQTAHSQATECVPIRHTHCLKHLDGAGGGWLIALRQRGVTV